MITVAYSSFGRLSVQWQNMVDKKSTFFRSKQR